MRAIKKYILFFFLFALPFYSLAWGVLGHRIVGEIADSYLTAKTKAEIKKILGNESIAMASNWGDFIKSDSSYDYLYNWHFINFPGDLDSQELQTYLGKDTVTDVYTRINFLIKELKNKQLPVEQKRMYLRLLIHLVGDAHQPLHAGHKEDLGGNRVKVLWFNNPSNLHSVWDESLVNLQQLSYTEYTRAINFTTAAQRLSWQKQTISQWIIESYQIAEKLYDEIKEENQKLGYRYNFVHINTVNDRLLKGGVRLAGLLNQIFG
jgi:hypothetical protein